MYLIFNTNPVINLGSGVYVRVHWRPVVETGGPFAVSIWGFSLIFMIFIFFSLFKTGSVAIFTFKITARFKTEVNKRKKLSTHQQNFILALVVC